MLFPNLGKSPEINAVIALAQAILHLPDGTALGNSPLTGVVVLLYTTLMAAGLIVAAGWVFHFQAQRVNWTAHKQTLLAWPWGWREGVTLLLGLLLLQVLTALALWLISRLKHVTPSDSTQFILQTISLDWLGLVLIGLMLARRGWDWGKAFGLTTRGLGRILALGGVAFVAVMPFFWFYSMLYALGLRWFGVDPTLQQVALTITGQESLGVRIYLIFVAVMMAPLFEEMLFRGIILPALAKRIGVGHAIILVALLFALVHLHLPALLPLMVMSIAFSLAYLYSGNLLVPIVMHGLFNAFNLALLTALR